MPELTAELLAAIQASPVYAAATARFNEYVRDCNQSGHVLSPAERTHLQTIRILLVLKDDPGVRKLYAGYLWEQMEARENA